MGLSCPAVLRARMMSIALPNWRLTTASTWMPGILAWRAPCAPRITESPTAVTCGGGAGWVGVVGAAPGLVVVVVVVVVVGSGALRNLRPSSIRGDWPDASPT